MTTAVFLIVYHMVKNHVIIFKFAITEKFGGEAGVFGGEASPPSPPIDETLVTTARLKLISHNYGPRLPKVTGASPLRSQEPSQ